MMEQYENEESYMKDALRIATYNDNLALWQANFVKEKLQKKNKQLAIELVTVCPENTLDETLIQNQADCTVLSMRYCPLALNSPFILGAILERNSPFDMIISHQYKNLGSLPKGSTVGVSSLRQQSQIKALRHDLNFMMTEPHLPTYFEKLNKNECDAFILSAFEQKSLDKNHTLLTSQLKPFECLPAIGEGTLGIMLLEKNQTVVDLFKTIHDPKTESCLIAERALHQALNSPDHAPVAGFAQYEEEHIRLTGLVAHPQGTQIIYNEVHGSHSDPHELGLQLAKKLLKEGAARIINARNLKTKNE